MGMMATIPTAKPNIPSSTFLTPMTAAAEGDGCGAELEGVVPGASVDDGEGEVVGGELDGAGETLGDDGGGDLEEVGDWEGVDAAAATVSTGSFIPPPQWPGAPQMKYRLPGDASGMIVFPPVCLCIGLLVWHES
ncbi:hypothetical protein ACLOJK_039625 [Asimina triloba]